MSLPARARPRPKYGRYALGAAVVLVLALGIWFLVAQAKSGRIPAKVAVAFEQARDDVNFDRMVALATPETAKAIAPLRETPLFSEAHREKARRDRATLGVKLSWEPIRVEVTGNRARVVLKRVMMVDGQTATREGRPLPSLTKPVLLRRDDGRWRVDLAYLPEVPEDLVRKQSPPASRKPGPKAR